MPTSQNLLPSGFNNAAIRCSVSDVDGSTSLSMLSDSVRINDIECTDGALSANVVECGVVTANDVQCVGIVFSDSSVLGSTLCRYYGTGLITVNTPQSTIGSTMVQYVLWNNTASTQYPQFQIRENLSASWQTMLNDTGGLAAGVTRAYGTCLVPNGWQWQISTNAGVTVMRVTVLDLK